MPSKATEFVVSDAQALSRLIGRLRATLREKGYFRGEIRTSRKRSLDQSAKYYAWLNQIYIERGEDSLLAVRNFCKLSFFVPVLISENEEFKDVYCATLSKLTHKEQLAAMEIIDVTSICSVGQMLAGMDAMQMHYAALDVDSVILD